MSFNDEIFKMLQDLAATRPFRADGVAKITNHELQPAPSPSNPYFAIFTARDDAHPHIRALELRVPQQGATAQDGILILDLQAKSCISQQQVKARFGDRPEPRPPSPHAPPTAPTYLLYRHPWGSMSFGFERAGRECLTTVVLDATKKGG